MVRHRQIIGIENAATAIIICIDQHYYMFIGGAGKHIVHIAEVERRQVSR